MNQIFNIKSGTRRRRILRNSMPLPEIILWSRLKNKQMKGYKFRRQFSVGSYIIDFYCPSAKLAIEIDGNSHFINQAQEYDTQRQLYIQSFDIRFLRFTNIDVMNNLEHVLELIQNHLPQPLLRKGGEQEKIIHHP